MNITTEIRLNPDKETSTILLGMMRRFNDAVNYASKINFNEKIFNWLKLQRRVYCELRGKFGLTAHQATIAVRKAAYMYKGKRRNKNTLAQCKPLSGMALYRHTYKKGNLVRFYGLKIPFKCREGINLSGKNQGTLIYRNGKFIIKQVVEVAELSEKKVSKWLGVDLGVCNIAVDSKGERFSGCKVNGLRRRHRKLRSKLQSKGTRSARRLLKKRSRKEMLFGKSVNHIISKKIVQKAGEDGAGIALEDLKGIRNGIKVRKAQRAELSSWSFGQLRSFIEYKAKRAGIPVMCVDPRNTSRTCPVCGNVNKANRKNQSEFICVLCGYVGHADHIAATNIAHRAMLCCGVVGNQPNVSVQSGLGTSSLLVVKG